MWCGGERAYNKNRHRHRNRSYFCVICNFGFKIVHGKYKTKSVKRQERPTLQSNPISIPNFFLPRCWGSCWSSGWSRRLLGVFIFEFIEGVFLCFKSEGKLLTEIPNGDLLNSFLIIADHYPIPIYSLPQIHEKTMPTVHGMTWHN